MRMQRFLTELPAQYSRAELASMLCPVFQEKEGYFKMMQKHIGADVTSLVTLPVIIFEPMTMLQKMCEVRAAPSLW